MVPGQIKLIAMDVDGVLTDGSIIIGTNGFEAKSFNTRDGLGLNILVTLGYKVLWITGRRSDVVERRAVELRIPYVRQGVVNKVQTIEELLSELNLDWENVMYIGDDLNDLLPLQKAAFACAVNDASPEVKQIADYITKADGGAGAIREIIESFLKHEKKWSKAVEIYLNSARQTKFKGEVQ